MREFKFGEVKTSFLFNGEVFEINVTKAGSVMGDIGQLLGDAAENGNILEENINKVLEKLDAVLGEGNVDKIFEGRKIEVGDVCDLVNFISEEVMEYSHAKRVEAEKVLAQANTGRLRFTK